MEFKKFSSLENTYRQNVKEVVLSEEDSKLINTILDSLSEYINENRIDNVISKEGCVSEKSFGKMIGLVVKDAVDDFKKDSGVDPTTLDCWKIINNELFTITRNLLKTKVL